MPKNSKVQKISMSIKPAVDLSVNDLDPQSGPELPEVLAGDPPPSKNEGELGQAFGGIPSSTFKLNLSAAGAGLFKGASKASGQARGAETMDADEARHPRPGYKS